MAQLPKSTFFCLYQQSFHLQPSAAHDRRALSNEEETVIVEVVQPHSDLTWTLARRMTSYGVLNILPRPIKVRITNSRDLLKKRNYYLVSLKT